jgi:hypothetical protein
LLILQWRAGAHANLQLALWKESLAFEVFLAAPLRNAPLFRFDVRGNLLDSLLGKYSN